MSGESGVVFVTRAADFARAAHAGQKRKYTGESYLVHLIEVAAMVGAVTNDHEVVAAALLHDAIEDTDVTGEQIEAAFGARVRTLVETLTDTATPADGNRKIRKAKYREQVAAGCAGVHDIKLADIISNARSIADRDPKFAQVYLVEKAEMLEVLDKGNRHLRSEAAKVIESSRRRLHERFGIDQMDSVTTNGDRKRSARRSSPEQDVKAAFDGVKDMIRNLLIDNVNVDTGYYLREYPGSTKFKDEVVVPHAEAILSRLDDVQALMSAVVAESKAGGYAPGVAEPDRSTAPIIK